MRFTTRQKLFCDYMLRQIGLSNPEHIDAYLEHLEKLYGKMISYPSERYISGEGWYFSVSGCVEMIKEEIQIKKNKHEIKLNELSETIAATDLANYNYCPVSYAINKSFIIENPSGKDLTEVGLNFHEQMRLIYKKSDQSDQVVEQKFIITNDIIDKIRNSRNIFCGHEEEKIFFTNGKFIGTPDYIFQDEEGKYFVVEEKFHHKHDPNKASVEEIMDSIYGGSSTDIEAEAEREKWSRYTGYFFSNHITQVLAYINNIKEYKIEYGYLVYWYYDFNDNGPYIHKVATKRIFMDNENSELYNMTLKNLEELISKKNQDFSKLKINMKKCAGCVVNKYCGHKNSKFDKVTLPYQLYYLKLYFTNFPEELKKPKV